MRQQNSLPSGAKGGGLGLTDALSSLHCFPAAHSSATGKECQAGLPAPLPVVVHEDLRPGMQAHWGGASAWGEGCPLTLEAQAWPGSQVSMEKGARLGRGEGRACRPKGPGLGRGLVVWGRGGSQGWSQML